MRFEDVTSEDTRIKFLTDGMLLREAISDSLLRKYSCVILDEAHERTIHTDVLFGVVKAAQKRRKELGKLPLKVCGTCLRTRSFFGGLVFVLPILLQAHGRKLTVVGVTQASTICFIEMLSNIYAPSSSLFFYR